MNILFPFFCISLSFKIRKAVRFKGTVLTFFDFVKWFLLSSIKNLSLKFIWCLPLVFNSPSLNPVFTANCTKSNKSLLPICFNKIWKLISSIKKAASKQPFSFLEIIYYLLLRPLSPNFSVQICEICVSISTIAFSLR